MSILQEMLKLNEGTLDDLEAKIIDGVLPKLKAYIEKYHDDIDHFVDSGSVDDYLYDVMTPLTKGVEWTKEHDKLETKLKRMKRSAWEAAFKAKYNTTDKEIIARLEKAGEKKFSPEELKFVKDLSSRITTRLTVKDFDPQNEYRVKWYMKSPEKFVALAPDIVGQVYTDETLAKFGMSIEKLKAMFERFGIKQGKRPVHKRSAPSYYD